MLPCNACSISDVLCLKLVLSNVNDSLLMISCLAAHVIHWVARGGWGTPQENEEK